MPKLSAGNTLTEEIVRVDIDPATLNEKNPDGTYKFGDDQIREWLHKLRGERETTIAKAQTKANAAPSGPAKPKFSAEDMTDE